MSHSVLRIIGGCRAIISNKMDIKIKNTKIQFNHIAPVLNLIFITLAFLSPLVAMDHQEAEADTLPFPAAQPNMIPVPIINHAATPTLIMVPPLNSNILMISPAPTTFTPVPTSRPTLGPTDWQRLPISPAVSQNARAIYERGRLLGNNPKAFSKVGDCNSLPPTFLTFFDEDSSYYHLGDYSFLLTAIDQFQGSFKRQSFAVGNGFNTSALLSPVMADPANCQPNETPLACEYRIQKPSFALIAVGTDDYVNPTQFEQNLRKIIEITINDGIVPIIATKVDDANHLNLNAITARLANEYDVPLWNLWLAVQPLKGQGLADNIHPSGIIDAFNFTTNNLAKYGWPVRNMTALKALYTTWLEVSRP
jgi:hypothetical protein